MNWLVKLRDERGEELVAKGVYVGYSKRGALQTFRKDNSLKGKRLGDRLYVEKIGIVV